ncbi:MAG: hypothetical protein IJ146_05175, partial [Kiritimatiellae bacterium]|nr:hypothetical protein [Kiritimatiellia bacterium]
ATSCTFGFAIASEVCIGGNCEKYEVIGKKYLLVLRGGCDILLSMRDIRILETPKGEVCMISRKFRLKG